MSSASRTVLVVEDESSLGEAVAYNLEREGFHVRLVSDGALAMGAFRDISPDIVLIDVMLPSISGFDLCRMIRSESTVPVIMLTAKDSEADKVTGLELGADDYMTKPFSMRELISRVRAQLRRASMEAAPASLKGGDVELDQDRHEVKVRGRSVPMTPKEFALLALFLERRGKLVTRDTLIRRVWGEDYFGDTKTLDVHIKRLREKIEPDPHKPRWLVTVRGLGYKFVDGASNPD